VNIPEKKEKKGKYKARRAFTLLNSIKPIAADLKLLQYKVFVIDLFTQFYLYIN